MNKAITDGVVFMPPAFANGLDVWSRQNGTPGSDTYASAMNAAFVPADQDFAGCLELQKVDATQKVRYMGETPLLPGCYLRITVRIKAISGNLPNVRIAGWAGGAGGAHVAGLVETGPSTTLTQYGEVVEVSAIVGGGQRGGVDMVWGAAALYGHFGLDLTGPTGGIVRIDDIIIEDITSAFLRDMLGTVDVRDYGALGDGSSDDLAAFEAADADAAGRTVMVPAGVYHLGDSMTFENRVQFEGTVTMPDTAVFSLTKNFDLPAYIDAFGDDVLAFRKAFQSLLGGSGHESLDMGGRSIAVHAPIDLSAAAPNRTTYATRRVIRNGQFDARESAAWDEDVVTSQATYSTSSGTKLTGVVNVANIAVGSLVEGTGVGREVYVRARNVATQELTLNTELYDAEGTQTFTFRRFKYLVDFSGFARIDKIGFTDIEFQCGGRSSGIMLAPTGVAFRISDCFITRPLDRGITSPGEGCQGLTVDRCQFLSEETGELAQNRRSIVLNTAGSDVKLRDNRSTRFRHFAVIAGTGSIITGNHFFQGDGAPNGLRMAGIVFTATNTRSIVNGNYVDNCFIEWTNEHDNAPEYSSELSFSQLNISDNVFLTSHVAPWFSFIVVKPYGAGHYLNHVVVQGNLFRTIGGNIERAERVDTSFADLNYDRVVNVAFTDNMFKLIDNPAFNPLLVNHDQATAAQVWSVNCAPNLPFGGYARNVESVQPIGPIRDAGNAVRHVQPYVNLKQGPNDDQVEVVWDQPLRGEVAVKVRMD